MRGMPFDVTGKGPLEILAAQIFGTGEGEVQGGTFGKKGEVLEPKSVLDHGRSPSPPTSSSTPSSSLGSGGGGGGSTDAVGVAAVFDNPAHKWACGDQPLLGSVEMGGFVAGNEKRGGGAEDLETMLSESAASPCQEQAFLRWIMGDIDDSSSVAKLHHQQLQQHLPVEFDAELGGMGFGLVEPGFGFIPIGGVGGAPPVSAPSDASIGSAASLPYPGGFPQTSSTRNNRSAGLSQPTSPQPSDLPGSKNASFVNPPSSMTLPPVMFFQELAEEKTQFFGSNLLLNLQQARTPLNPAFFLPRSSFITAPEQHHTPDLLPPHNQSLSFSPFHPAPYHLPQQLMNPNSLAPGDKVAAAAVAVQQQSLVDQLFEAADFVENGNFVGAHWILARLNHQLPAPLGNPLLRSAFYFREALQLLADSCNHRPAITSSPSHHHRTPFTTSLVTPWDVVLKLSAYKAFSEVSPLLHFTSLTITQALLEEIGTSECIHIIDFDIGVGGQWSSFMQELAQRHSPAVPLLKITAFVSACAFHPLELHLTRENLSQFAADLNIPFEINISSIESFDPAEILAVSAGSNEAIAVNLPVGAVLRLPFSTMLLLVKKLLPKIVVSVVQGCDRSDLPFSHHFLHAFQSSMVLLDSIDAAGSNLDMANKIERFFLQPRIENCIIVHQHAADKMLQWRTHFASAGFVPVQFSNFTEMQAECLLKRIQVGGFHVEKRQASLYLYWQQGELVSVSAWRC